MDENKKPSEAGRLPLQGPHWHRSQSPETAAEFIPLRLRLQPGGQAVEFTTPNALIGRHTDADLRLPLPDVSRRHCRCFFADGLWQITDLNSLNGIYVNGERVQQADLHQGDVIGIGGFSFEVDVGSAAGTVQFQPNAAEHNATALQSIADVLRQQPPDADGERRIAS